MNMTRNQQQANYFSESNVIPEMKKRRFKKKKNTIDNFDTNNDNELIDLRQAKFKEKTISKVLHWPHDLNIMKYKPKMTGLTSLNNVYNPSFNQPSNFDIMGPVKNRS